MKPSQSTGRAKGKFPRFRVLLFCCLALGLGGYLYFNCYWPDGSGPAGPAVPAENFAKPWTQRKVLLVGLGDSVTAGFGALRGYGYFDRLAKNVPGESADMKGLCLSAAIPKLTVLNLAVPGTNSFYHLQKEIASLKAQEPDVLGLVMMTTGGNDLVHSYGRSPPREGAMYGATVEQAKPWTANFRTRLEEMIRQVRGKFPGGCHIFIADIFDPTDGAGVPWFVPFPAWKESNEVLRQYNAVIHDVCRAERNVHLVPMHDAFLGHGFCCRQSWKPCYHGQDPTYWYCEIIEDPNARGYDALRRLFLLEIAKVFP